MLEYTSRQVTQLIRQYEMFLKSINILTDNSDKEKILTQMTKIKERILEETNSIYEEEYMLLLGSSTYLVSDISNKSYAGSLYTNRSTKYVETYSTAYSSSVKGDAVYETSSSSSGTTSWDGDYSYAPDSSRPVFERGGYYDAGSNAGVFCFVNYIGSADTYYGFRAVLAIP